jgi:uncharacterized membrane protein YczE
MRKLRKTNELLWLFGIIFVAFGVALCSKADLGVSMIAAPAFILSEALCPLFPFLSVGVVEYIVQGIFLIALCVIIRRFDWRFLLAFAVAVLYGYILDFFIWLLGDITLTNLWMRWILLLAGDCIVGFGVACFFRTYMPLQVHELFVAEITTRFSLSLPKVKWVFDISLLMLSVLLATTLFGDLSTYPWSAIAYQSFHNIGLGTLVTTFINSFLINWMGKFLDRIFDPTPAFPKWETVLKRN